MPEIESSLWSFPNTGGAPTFRLLRVDLYRSIALKVERPHRQVVRHSEAQPHESRVKPCEVQHKEELLRLVA